MDNIIILFLILTIFYVFIITSNFISGQKDTEEYCKRETPESWGKKANHKLYKSLSKLTKYHEE